MDRPGPGRHHIDNVFASPRGVVSKEINYLLRLLLAAVIEDSTISHGMHSWLRT